MTTCMHLPITSANLGCKKPCIIKILNFYEEILSFKVQLKLPASSVFTYKNYVDKWDIYLL